MNNGFLNMASIGDFDPLNASIPATKVEITVSCRNLLDRDTFSKSDPSKIGPSLCLSVTHGDHFGRTEVIDNTLNPDFVRKFILDYFFEERQNLRFDFRLDKALGGIPGKKCGTIIVKAEELNNCRESVMMQFCGNKLDKKDFFGKSDPFLVFHRSNEDGTFTICHKTEVVKNTLNPVWQAFKIPVRALCNGDYDRTIKVEVYDWDRDGSHDFIGEFSTSYRELSRGQSQFNVYEVGLFVCECLSACELACTCVCMLLYSIQSCLSCLHHCTGQQVTYTHTNGNPQNPYCAGIDGVMEAYYQSLKSVQLYGPTNFSPVINHVARYAASVKDGSQYFVLLIITDGVISDMAQTKESIVNAACLPMSIIIVGVGPAEFDAMIELDGDEVRISSRGRYAERDIVQFVPFRDYIDRTGNHILSMARLAKDVLAEIPDQFLSYMRTRGIKPSPAPPPYTPPSQPIQTMI
uniref:Copine 8 n=1 Tax=Seriola lalandi dorsalis TaxID=1841481 RepID=A0A3B4XFY8_SERLL